VSFHDDRRPDPEVLLAQVRAEERRATRGRLRIFFGAAPGVGKTYAMLEAARARVREGVDVVIGVLETHGRPETAALLEGLPALPKRDLEYRGIALQEFDLDASLARRPGLLLVDELAHTNAPGSRHAKRWQDVEELLDAGISVYSTLNVQHIESLNDVVARITGITVRETLPDAVFDQADELELADLAAEDLLARLHQGKVYVPEQAAAAVERFFRKGNLIALRELTLRRAAERVDAQMRGYMAEAGIHATWPAAERLLVCIGPNPDGARLVRAGKRMAAGLKCEWRVVYVERPGQAVSDAERDALVANLQLAQSLGAQTAALAGQYASEEILAYARDQNVTKIVVGKPTHPRWRDAIGGSLLDRLVRGSGDVDVYVITGDAEPAPRRRAAGRRSPLVEYAWAALALAVCTVLAVGLIRIASVTDVAMLYLLGVGFVASRFGRGPSVVAAVGSIAAFDFFFVPPFHTFAVSDARYVLTFGVMLFIALVISALTHRLRAQAETARERERRTGALYAMTRDLAASRGRSEVTAVASGHLAASFGAQVQILLPDAAGRLEIPVGVTPAFPVDEKERSVAQWVFERGRPAGAGTDTLPAALARYVPLAGSLGTVGVAGLRVADAKRLHDPGVERLLETFVAQAALALERVILAERAQQEQVEVQAERLRTALLSSLSHDMRTPLGAITGAASSLLADGGAGGALGEGARRDLLTSILTESQRMNRLIGNLLDMIRLETGALEVQRDWQPLEEVIGVALIRLDERLREHPVEVRLPPDLPLALLDGLLIEQVFVNLLENAVKYTPAGTPIEISASVQGGAIAVDVADRGPGFPPGEEGRVFEKFYRVPGVAGAGGVGLGLTICRGIVTAHGGRIWAENRAASGADSNRAGGGAVFHFTLPLVGTPPSGMPVESDDG
jgi:two-component system sensor histidine kinase KdpD